MFTDDTTSRLYLSSDTTCSPLSDGTSNPKPPEKQSVFSDGSCGEPLFSQHVIIDFTPNEYDTDFVQKKVCSFWQFINNSPEIQNLKVESEKNPFNEDFKTEIGTKSSNSEIEVSNVVKAADKQALEMLGFAEEKNLIDTIFEAELPQTMCSLGSREYKHSEVPSQPKKKEKKKHVCKCTPCSNPRCRNNKNASTVSSYEPSPARILSRKMNEWDAKHPKPLPNAVYMFTVSCYAFHPLIQRFVRLWRFVQVVSDVITFVLSMICCQCSDAMPLSSSTSAPSVQIFETNACNRRLAEVDPGRCSGEPMKAQHLVIDFTPGREDTPGTEASCQQFCTFAKNRTELEGMMVQPSPIPEPSKRRASVHPEIVIEQSNSNLPAIHMLRKINNKGLTQDALQTNVNKYCT